MGDNAFESRLKHLEFVQGVITRMNSNSFSMKGWMITIVAGFLAIFAAGKELNEIFLFVAVAPTLLFWLLDTYYLQMEKKYRLLYTDVVNGNAATFVMNTDEYKVCFFKVLFSKTEWTLYLVIIILLITGGVLGLCGIY